MLHQLPVEVWEEILTYLPGKEVQKISGVHSFFYGMSKAESIWQWRVKVEFGITAKQPGDERSWKEIYHFFYLNAPAQVVKIKKLFSLADEDFRQDDLLSVGLKESRSMNFTGEQAEEEDEEDEEDEDEEDEDEEDEDEEDEDDAEEELEEEELEKFIASFTQIESELNLWGKDYAMYFYHYLIRKTDFVSQIYRYSQKAALIREIWRTPLHVWAYLNKSELLEVILDQNPLLVDIEGYIIGEIGTPLSIAARNGCYEAAKVLIDHGASLSVHDDNEITPFLWAVRHAHSKLLPLLAQDHLPISSNEIACWLQSAAFEFILYEKHGLYLAEGYYFTRKLMGMDDADNFQLYLNDRLHEIDEEESEVKKTITWLYQNCHREGKVFISLPDLKKAFNVQPRECELHQQWLEWMDKHKNQIPCQANEAGVRLSPQPKRRKLA